MEDFNNADTQSSGFDIIPDDTIATFIGTVRPGSAGDGGWLTQGKPTAKSHSGWLWLDMEFVIIGGPYDKRKVWQKFMWHNAQPADGAAEGAEKAANISRSNIRAMIESARNVMPDDHSPDAQAKRQINDFGALNGMTFRAKLGIEEGSDGYDDKNNIKFFITPDQSEYAGEHVPPTQMATPVAATPVPATPVAAAPPAQQPIPPASGVPAWAQK